MTDMSPPNGSNTAVLILAAGVSSRLGESKQLVKFRGKTLLEHAADHALSITSDVFVVLGHGQDACQAVLGGLPVKTLYNPAFAEGMGTSIALGIRQLQGYEHVLILLSDQPLIPREHYRALAEAMEQNPRAIIASFYHGKPGVPAVFPCETFPQLARLSGDRGAKALLASPSSIFVPVDDRYTVDIDTKEDVFLLGEMEAKQEK